MPPAGAFKLKRDESAPAVEGMRVAAVPVPVVEGVELVGEAEPVLGLVEVKVVMAVDLPLADEALTVTDEVEDPLVLELEAAPTENVPVEA